MVCYKLTVNLSIFDTKTVIMDQHWQIIWQFTSKLRKSANLDMNWFYKLFVNIPLLVVQFLKSKPEVDIGPNFNFSSLSIYWMLARKTKHNSFPCNNRKYSEDGDNEGWVIAQGDHWSAVAMSHVSQLIVTTCHEHKQTGILTSHQPPRILIINSLACFL